MASGQGRAVNQIYQLTETRHGQMVVLSHDSYISRSLIEYGEWTESEFGILSQMLQPGDHVIDVGANLGSLTLAFAARVAGDGSSPPGHVFAFEPQPRIFQLLAANCVLNHLTNVRLFNAGCGAAPAEIEISEIGYESEMNYGALNLELLRQAAAAPSSPARRKVQILRLDDVFDRSTLKLIKIDVEGMELDVLHGASRLIAELRPVLYIENEYPEKSPALLKSISDRGYDIWWHLAPCFNPDNFRRRSDNMFGDTGCYNVLCMPSERSVTIHGLTKIVDLDGHPRKSG